jgi:hypothetical protein
MDGWTMSMRELSVLETGQVGGAFSWVDLGAHMIAGGVTGALAGALVGGLGVGPGALGGFLLGGIDYGVQSFINLCW